MNYEVKHNDDNENYDYPDYDHDISPDDDDDYNEENSDEADDYAWWERWCLDDFFDYDNCDGGVLKIMMMTTIMLVLMKSSVFDYQSDVSYVTSF